MSTSPAPPDPEPDDDFPQPGDGTETATFMAGGRFSGGGITGLAAPGHVLGDVIGKLSKLYSALESRGTNVTRAVADYPWFLRKLDYVQSVDLLYEGARPDDATPQLIANKQDPVQTSHDALATLTAAGDDIAEIAAGYGAAVTHAYRQLAALLGDREITAAFFVARDMKPDDQTFVRLEPGRALAQAEALSSQHVIRVERTTLTGLLDELAGLKGTFKLVRPSTLTSEYRSAWDEAVGRHSIVEGELTEAGENDVRRLNAWNSRVTAELELTHLTSPKSTKKEEIEAKLLRITQMHLRLDDD